VLNERSLQNVHEAPSGSWNLLALPGLTE